MDLFNEKGILIASLLFNIYLLIKYVIFGPRKIRDQKEFEISLRNMQEYLNWDMTCVTLDKPSAVAKQECDGIFMTSPRRREQYQSWMKKLDVPLVFNGEEVSGNKIDKE